MARERICLNGEWDFIPVYGVKTNLELPEGLKYDQQKNQGAVKLEICYIGGNTVLQKRFWDNRRLSAF